MPKFSTSSKTWKHLVITGLSSRKIRHYMETMLRSHPNMGVFNLYNTCFFFHIPHVQQFLTFPVKDTKSVTRTEAAVVDLRSLTAG
jgi:hypothetical protein